MLVNKEELATILQNAASAVLSGDSPEGKLYFIEAKDKPGMFELNYNIALGRNDGRISVVGS